MLTLTPYLKSPSAYELCSFSTFVFFQLIEMLSLTKTLMLTLTPYLESPSVYELYSFSTFVFFQLIEMLSPNLNTNITLTLYLESPSAYELCSFSTFFIFFQLIEMLSPNQRMKLDKRFDQILEQTVRHGMSVATASRDELKDEIVHVCRKVRLDWG